MTEIKVVLAENQDEPLSVLLESLKKSGCEIVVCNSGFDALDELLNSGGDILITAESLPDVTGFQLSCLLKSTMVTGSLPIVVVSSAADGQDGFWKRASLADSVLKRTQVEKNAEDSVKLISRLAKSKTGISPAQIDSQPVITGAFAGSDLVKSFGELLNGLLAERLVRHFARKLSATVNDRAEFTTEFFDTISRLFKPDVAGIIVGGTTPWSVYHLSKGVNKELLDSLIESAINKLGITGSVPANFYGEPVNEKGVKLQKARVIDIPAPDGSKLGVVIVGWSSDRVIDNILKTALEHFRDQLVPVLQLVIERDKYNHLEAQAQYWSMVDPISGLYNMEFLMGFLQQQLLFSKRQNLNVGLCIIDVDGFVGLNAQYGSDTGNLLLKILAERMGNCVRSSDLMARYSGDQFVVVLPNTNLEGTMILAEKLRSEAEKINPDEQMGKKNLRVTISVGCAQFNQQDLAPEAIIKDAKDALLRAKEKGRNAVSD